MVIDVEKGGISVVRAYVQSKVPDELDLPEFKVYSWHGVKGVAYTDLAKQNKLTDPDGDTDSEMGGHVMAASPLPADQEPPLTLPARPCPFHVSALTFVCAFV